MNTEMFEGRADQLNDRLGVLIGGGSTINQVITTHTKGMYIIIYS